LAVAFRSAFQVFPDVTGAEVVANGGAVGATAATAGALSRCRESFFWSFPLVRLTESIMKSI
jgi:hypothetical protein